MEELEKIEVEEVARVDISEPEIPLIYPSSDIDEPLVFVIDWSSIFPMSPFSFGLFTDLGIPNIIETFFNIRSSF